MVVLVVGERSGDYRGLTVMRSRAMTIQHRGTGESKSPQIFRIHANFATAVVWILLVLPLTSDLLEFVFGEREKENSFPIIMVATQNSIFYNLFRFSDMLLNIPASSLTFALIDLMTCKTVYYTRMRRFWRQTQNRHWNTPRQVSIEKQEERTIN